MWMFFKYSLALALVLFSAFIDGRSLQQSFSNENLSKVVLANNNTSPVKAISLAMGSTNDAVTNYNDVLGVAKLCLQYPGLMERGDDPCVPSSFTWLRCNSDPKPRIISLNLENQYLFSPLPDFSTMDALQSIDLSDNLLSGAIPSFLGQFPSLQELDLSNNILLSGPVPDSLACNKKLNLSISGNPELETPNSCSKSSSSSSDVRPPPTLPRSGEDPADSSSDIAGGGSFTGPATRSRTKKKSILPAILGSTISAFVLFWVGIGIFMMHRHKAKSAAAVAEASPTPVQESPNGGTLTEERPMKTATNNIPSS